MPMTSFWCFSIKGLRTWLVGVAGLFCITPFYSANRVLSFQGSRFKVRGSVFDVPHPTHPLTHSRRRATFGCGFAALCSSRLCGGMLFLIGTLFFPGLGRTTDQVAILPPNIVLHGPAARQ